ncbi:MAG: thioether cross-link-forming SCIFF peptide maturase [Oscillospiraceae bacterium]|nr:thioether cross-link-forming SCIFF peptide maturase [Oscillospiraceae bacterium]
MVHSFEMNGKYIVLDVYSGCVHDVDKLAFDVMNALTPPLAEELSDDILQKLSAEYSADEIREVYTEILALSRAGQLFSEDTYKEMILPSDGELPPVKAMCLHVAHDCNLRCKYCFADDGAYQGSRALMSEEIALGAVDFLVANSANRRNLEIDFFGGEPLMNFGVVKKTVEYARALEKKFDKNFRFTITTNGVLLNDENMKYINENMHNVVLSLDGRKDVNDRVRKTAGGGGSYDLVLKKLLTMAESRNQDNYYVRGTYTAYNLDFAADVLHLADLGFVQTSVEPAVAADDKEYALREEHLPRLFDEYERLAAEYARRMREKDDEFRFFHFMIDLEQGPCVIKRLSGCGAGCEYVAVTPEGDIYPCHQFVGMIEYKIGDIENGIQNEEIRTKLNGCNVYTKDVCSDCFAKFYCGGGCVANAGIYNGDVNVPHKVSCELQKKRVECALYVECARGS